MPSFVVTGNLTREGLTAYLRLDNGKRIWVQDIAAATVAESEDEAKSLIVAAQEDVDATLVVGIYHLEIELNHGVPVPKTARERIRAAHKPTIPYGQT